MNFLPFSLISSFFFLFLYLSLSLSVPLFFYLYIDSCTQCTVIALYLLCFIFCLLLLLFTILFIFINLDLNNRKISCHKELLHLKGGLRVLVRGMRGGERSELKIFGTPPTINPQTYKQRADTWLTYCYISSYQDKSLPFLLKHCT